jgi:hypothetical protein
LKSGVSIPSRGFWFFEVETRNDPEPELEDVFQSPCGDFGFLKSIIIHRVEWSRWVGGFNPLAGILVF